MQTTRQRLPIKPWDWLRPSNPLLPPFHSGVYSDSQLVSSILMGRSFFTLHLEDAISVCPFYSSRADIVPSRWVNPTWAGEALNLHVLCWVSSACAPSMILVLWPCRYHECSYQPASLAVEETQIQVPPSCQCVHTRCPFRA